MTEEQINKKHDPIIQTGCSNDGKMPNICVFLEYGQNLDSYKVLQ